MHDYLNAYASVAHLKAAQLQQCNAAYRHAQQAASAAAAGRPYDAAVESGDGSDADGDSNRLMDSVQVSVYKMQRDILREIIA